MTKTSRPLLFINKTGSSQQLSKSRPRESAAIFRHVQRNRRVAEGLRREPEWSRLSSTFTSSDDPDDTHEQAAVTPISERRPLSSRSSMPVLYPTSNGFDPFHCTVVGPDAGNHSLLRFTFSALARANFVAESFAPDPSLYAATRHQGVFDLRLERCIQDSMLMYATLAYSASFLAWTTGHHHHNKPLECFLGRAMSAVRTHLARGSYPIDDWLLLSLYSLAITELWNGSPGMWTQHPDRRSMAMDTAEPCKSACRMHLNALLHLVERAGGWDHFSPYVLESVILADKYLAISSTQPPLMASTWDPGPLSADLRNQHGISGNPYPELGTRLLAAPLDINLREDLEDLVWYINTAHTVWSEAYIDATLESWLFCRLQAINHRLLSKAHSKETRLPDRCVALAALKFVAQCLVSKGPQLSATRLARTLKLELKGARGQLPRGVYLWCLCMGALLPDSSESKPWYVSQLQEELAGREGWDDLVSVLPMYLFLPERQGGALAKLYAFMD